MDKDNRKIDPLMLSEELFNKVLLMADESPRRRMHYDLRTQVDEEQWHDSSQRMLNALMPETIIPIHRHCETSETVIVLRGAVEEIIYDERGSQVEKYILRYGSDCPGIQVPRGVYHTCRCIEPGSVIFECKDRPYDPDTTEDMLRIE